MKLEALWPGTLLKRDSNTDNNFIEITIRHGCSSVNVLHISGTPFLEHLWKVASGKSSGKEISWCNIIVSLRLLVSRIARFGGIMINISQLFIQNKSPMTFCSYLPHWKFLPWGYLNQMISFSTVSANLGLFRKHSIEYYIYYVPIKTRLWKD